MTLLLDVDLPEGRADVRLDGERVVDVGRLSRRSGETCVQGRGGALLPGLHDHHVHLLATAAARSSVDLRGGLAALAASGEGWVRGIRWSGDGDRHVLDAVQSGRPVRVQHVSGALWVVNSAGVAALGLEEVDHPGVERDAAGRPTGRLWRADDLLARRLGRVPPDLEALGRQLAGLGVTGVTDATPDLDASTVALLHRSVPQRLQLLGDAAGSGPVKVVLPDHDLPGLDALVARLRAARPRPVAVHCVTAASLVLLLAALEEVGRLPGDRVEHASVVPPSLAAKLPTVVTQPGFLADRGDAYLREVPPDELPDLYRYRSLQQAGTSVVASSDAPFGPLDPWQVMVAARDRRCLDGRVLGPEERVPVEVVLDGMLRPLEDLRGPARRVVPGAAADLVLLRVPRRDALAAPCAEHVRTTWIAGRVRAGKGAVL